MTTMEELLSGCDCFRGMSPEALAVIAGYGREVSFTAGQHILREGEPADEFHVVRSGRVAIDLPRPGGDPLVIETVGPGQLLGLSWILPPYRWLFDALAVEPTTTVAVSATELRQRCDEDPALGYQLFQRFAGVVRDRLVHTRLQLLDVYGHVS